MGWGGGRGGEVEFIIILIRSILSGKVILIVIVPFRCMFSLLPFALRNVSATCASSSRVDQYLKTLELIQPQKIYMKRKVQI